MGLDVTEAQTLLENLREINSKFERNNLCTEWDKKLPNRFSEITNEILFSTGLVWIEHTSLYNVTYRHEGYVVEYNEYLYQGMKVLKMWSTVYNELVIIWINESNGVDFGDLEESTTKVAPIFIGLSDNTM
ncbi:hypothetical protein DIDNDMLP_00155 [Klebsiella phage KP13-7]|nr:hypothetical protein DIDNDMLP_00155 [Klebsiella phage KP13-7]